MVQHSGRHAQQAHAAHSPRHEGAAGMGSPGPHLPCRMLQAGTRHRARMDRHTRRGIGEIQILPCHPARACLCAGGGSRHTCTHLFQERVGEPAGLTQDQLRPAPVLLCQAGGHDQRDHRDGCRPMGCRTVVCRKGVRTGVRRLSGENIDAAEALPVEHHAHLRRNGGGLALYVDACRKGHHHERPHAHGFARHRHLRGC